jgi:hypothetical protein
MVRKYKIDVMEQAKCFTVKRHKSLFLLISNKPHILRNFNFQIQKLTLLKKHVSYLKNNKIFRKF